MSHMNGSSKSVSAMRIMSSDRPMPNWINETHDRIGPKPPAIPLNSNQIQKQLPPPPLPKKSNNIEPDYEIIEFSNQQYSNAAPVRPKTPDVKRADGLKCQLCGSPNPWVRCDQCGNQIFCATCDDMFHRHPKRQSHVRKAMEKSQSIKPPLPPKTDLQFSAPVAPPRRNKKAFPSPLPVRRDQSGLQPQQNGTLKRTPINISNRPLPETPTQASSRSSTPNSKSVFDSIQKPPSITLEKIKNKASATLSKMALLQQRYRQHQEQKTDRSKMNSNMQLNDQMSDWSDPSSPSRLRSGSMSSGMNMPSQRPSVDGSFSGYPYQMQHQHHQMDSMQQMRPPMRTSASVFNLNQIGVQRQMPIKQAPWNNMGQAQSMAQINCAGCNHQGWSHSCGRENWMDGSSQNLHGSNMSLNMPPGYYPTQQHPMMGPPPTWFNNWNGPPNMGYPYPYPMMNGMMTIQRPPRSRGGSRAGSPALSIKSRKSMMSRSHKRNSYVEHELTDDEDSEGDRRSIRSHRSELPGQRRRNLRKSSLNSQSFDDEIDDFGNVQKSRSKSRTTAVISRERNDRGPVTQKNTIPNEIMSARKQSATLIRDRNEHFSNSSRGKGYSDSPLTPDSENEPPTKVLVQAKIQEKILKEKEFQSITKQQVKKPAPISKPEEPEEESEEEESEESEEEEISDEDNKNDNKKKTIDEIPILGPPPSTPDHDWECEFCTFVNEANVKICAVCCKTPIQSPTKPTSDNSKKNFSPPKKIEKPSTTITQGKILTKKIEKTSKTSTSTSTTSAPLKADTNKKIEKKDIENISNQLNTTKISQSEDESQQLNGTKKKAGTIINNNMSLDDIWATLEEDIKSAAEANKRNNERNLSVENETVNHQQKIKTSTACGPSPPREFNQKTKNNASISTGTSPPPQSISTQTYDVLPPPKSHQEQHINDESFFKSGRSYSIASPSQHVRENSDSPPLTINTENQVQSLPPTPPLRNMSPIGIRKYNNEINLMDSDAMMNYNDRNQFQYYRDMPKIDRYRSTTDLRREEPYLSRRPSVGDMLSYQKNQSNMNEPIMLSQWDSYDMRRRDMKPRDAGSELVLLLKEAEHYKFTAEELQAALKHCGDMHPIIWLRENWSKLIKTVQTLATKYGQEQKENIIGTISSIEAREALRVHRGNVWHAVTECIEQRQKKYREIANRSNYSREDIVTALTAHHGNVELALIDLGKTQIKPFLMRIWGSPNGIENDSGNLSLDFGQKPNKFDIDSSIHDFINANAESLQLLKMKEFRQQSNSPHQQLSKHPSKRDLGSISNLSTQSFGNRTEFSEGFDSPSDTMSNNNPNLLKDIETLIANMEQNQAKQNESMLKNIENMLGGLLEYQNQQQQSEQNQKNLDHNILDQNELLNELQFSNEDTIFRKSPIILKPKLSKQSDIENDDSVEMNVRNFVSQHIQDIIPDLVEHVERDLEDNDDIRNVENDDDDVNNFIEQINEIQRNSDYNNAPLQVNEDLTSMSEIDIKDFVSKHIKDIVPDLVEQVRKELQQETENEIVNSESNHIIDEQPNDKSKIIDEFNVTNENDKVEIKPSTSQIKIDAEQSKSTELIRKKIIQILPTETNSLEKEKIKHNIVEKNYVLNSTIDIKSESKQTNPIQSDNSVSIEPIISEKNDSTIEMEIKNAQISTVTENNIEDISESEDEEDDDDDDDDDQSQMTSSVIENKEIVQKENSPKLEISFSNEKQPIKTEVASNFISEFNSTIAENRNEPLLKADNLNKHKPFDKVKIENPQILAAKIEITEDLPIEANESQAQNNKMQSLDENVSQNFDSSEFNTVPYVNKTQNVITENAITPENEHPHMLLNTIYENDTQEGEDLHTISATLDRIDESEFEHSEDVLINTNDSQNYTSKITGVTTKEENASISNTNQQSSFGNLIEPTMVTSISNNDRNSNNNELKNLATSNQLNNFDNEAHTSSSHHLHQAINMDKDNNVKLITNTENSSIQSHEINQNSGSIPASDKSIIRNKNEVNTSEEIKVDDQQIEKNNNQDFTQNVIKNAQTETAQESIIKQNSSIIEREPLNSEIISNEKTNQNQNIEIITNDTQNKLQNNTETEETDSLRQLPTTSHDKNFIQSENVNVSSKLTVVKHSSLQPSTSKQSQQSQQRKSGKRKGKNKRIQNKNFNSSASPVENTTIVTETSTKPLLHDQRRKTIDDLTLINHEVSVNNTGNILENNITKTDSISSGSLLTSSDNIEHYKSSEALTSSSNTTAANIALNEAHHKIKTKADHNHTSFSATENLKINTETENTESQKAHNFINQSISNNVEKNLNKKEENEITNNLNLIPLKTYNETTVNNNDVSSIEKEHIEEVKNSIDEKILTKPLEQNSEYVKTLVSEIKDNQSGNTNSNTVDDKIRLSVVENNHSPDIVDLSCEIQTRPVSLLEKENSEQPQAEGPEINGETQDNEPPNELHDMENNTINLLKITDTNPASVQQDNSNRDQKEGASEIKIENHEIDDNLKNKNSNEDQEENFKPLQEDEERIEPLSNEEINGPPFQQNENLNQPQEQNVEVKIEIINSETIDVELITNIEALPNLSEDILASNQQENSNLIPKESNEEKITVHDINISDADLRIIENIENSTQEENAETNIENYDSIELETSNNSSHNVEKNNSNKLYSSRDKLNEDQSNFKESHKNFEIANDIPQISITNHEVESEDIFRDVEEPIEDEKFKNIIDSSTKFDEDNVSNSKDFQDDTSDEELFSIQSDDDDIIQPKSESHNYPLENSFSITSFASADGFISPTISSSEVILILNSENGINRESAVISIEKDTDEENETLTEIENENQYKPKQTSESISIQQTDEEQLIESLETENNNEITESSATIDLKLNVTNVSKSKENSKQNLSELVEDTQRLIKQMKEEINSDIASFADEDTYSDDWSDDYDDENGSEEEDFDEEEMGEEEYDEDDYDSEEYSGTEEEFDQEEFDENAEDETSLIKNYEDLDSDKAPQPNTIANNIVNSNSHGSELTETVQNQSVPNVESMTESYNEPKMISNNEIAEEIVPPKSPEAVKLTNEHAPLTDADSENSDILESENTENAIVTLNNNYAKIENESLEQKNENSDKLGKESNVENNSSTILSLPRLEDLLTNKSDENLVKSEIKNSEKKNLIEKNVVDTNVPSVISGTLPSTSQDSSHSNKMLTTHGSSLGATDLKPKVKYESETESESESESESQPTSSDLENNKNNEIASTSTLKAKEINVTKKMIKNKNADSSISIVKNLEVNSVITKPLENAKITSKLIKKPAQPSNSSKIIKTDSGEKSTINQKTTPASISNKTAQTKPNTGAISKIPKLTNDKIRSKSFSSPPIITSVKRIQLEIFNKQQEATKIVKPSKLTPPRVIRKNSITETITKLMAPKQTPLDILKKNPQGSSSSSGLSKTESKIPKIPKKKYHETCFSDENPSSSSEDETAVMVERLRRKQSEPVFRTYPSLLQDSQTEPTEVIARKFVEDGLCSNYIEAELAAALVELKFQQDAALWAAKECSDLEQAISLLQQECELCTGLYPMNEIVSMLKCTHTCCKDCAKNYFTIQITDRSINDCNCPYCKIPELHDPDANEDEILEYFSNLDIFLKNILDKEVHELFQRKLRDRSLMQDPNFKWCVQCSSGFFARPKQKRLICPDCGSITCAQCRKPWEKQHDGLSCDKYQEWLDSNDPDKNIQGVLQHLAANGIDCPKCKFRFSLARGGCMHFTCTQCKYEFCYGCGKPFMMGAKCTVSSYCARLGLHSHHPRNCLFYLRDKEPKQLQDLLKMYQIQFDEEAHIEKTDSKTIALPKCPVPLQKETPTGLIDTVCNGDVPEKHAGLCRQHYVEYLVKEVSKANIDPLPILDLTDCVQELRRRGIALPERGPWDTDEIYRGMCSKIVEAQIPLN